MFSTSRWFNSPLSRHAQRMIQLSVVIGLIGTGCLQSFAGVSLPGLLSLTVSQSETTPPSTVKAQADHLFQLARKQIRSGNVNKGKAILQQVLMIDPQHKNAKGELLKLGVTGASIVPNQALIAASNQSVSTPTYDSLSSNELIDVSKAMMRDGDYGGALSVLEKALSKSTDEDEKKQIRAFIFAISKDKERMAKAKDSMISYNLSQIEKSLQKAAVYLENDQFEKAQLELHRAESIAPEDPRVKQMLNQVYSKQATSQKQTAQQQQLADAMKNQEQAAAAETLFNDAVILYREGQIIDAVEKWNQALQVYPDHQASQTYLTNTRSEFEQAVASKIAAEQEASQEAEWDKKLDESIIQYSTSGDRVDVKQVISFLSNLSGLNAVMAENLEGKVAFDVKDTTVRNVLNLLQKEYGFIWKRDKDTIHVKRGFQTRIFPLTEGQYKTIEVILNDPTTLEDTSRNLKDILYGPGEEFNVPGKQLFLNRATNALVITDTEENLRKVEAFLKDMPTIIGDKTKAPVETRTYRLNEDIAKDIYEIVKVVLFKGQGAYDITDTRRQLYLEPNSSVLIVIDYPENIEEIEKILASQQIQDSVEEGDLYAKQFIITDVDDVEDTPEAYERRAELVNSVAEIVEKMLYGAKGIEAAKLSGRICIPNPDRGTIDIVDSRDNIRRVDSYLNSIKGGSSQDILIEAFEIMHVDIYTITDALGVLFFQQQQSTRPLSLSQNAFQSVGTSEQGDTLNNVSDLYEETSRNIFNLSGGGGGAELSQFISMQIYPDPVSNRLIVVTPDPEVITLVSRVISTFDRPQRMIELEIRGVQVSLTDLRSINFDYILTDPLVDKISLNPENTESVVNMNTDTTDGFGLSVHTFGRSRLDFLMSLLESTTSFNVMSAPKVLTVANPMNPPMVFVGQQLPYADSVEFDDQGDDDPTNNRMVITYQRALVGTVMPIFPFVLNDDHVYLELQPQVIDPGERLPVTIQGTIPPGSSIPNVGPMLLNQQFLQTSIRLRNGATAVLGGMIAERENESVDKVPVLSKIPFLGNMFTDKRIEKIKVSTLFFVTARIVEPTL